MPREFNLISNIQHDWSDLTLRAAQKKTMGLFSDSSNVDKITRLKHLLNINETMGIDDLKKALDTIEQVNVKGALLSPDFTMGQWLDKNHHRILRDLGVGTRQTTSVTIEKDSALFRLLVKNHKTILNLYELAKARAHGDLPVSQVDYTKGQIATSQPFRDLLETSHALQLPDKSTSANDFKRKHVTIYGATIHPGDSNSNNDPRILETIENFAGDRIDQPHSRANKIYNFGGQFIDAILLQEFSNTTLFEHRKTKGFERGSIKGHLNWSKNPDTQEIYATAELAIYSCVYADVKDKCAPQKFYAMSSDAVSLIALDDDQLEKIMKRCGSEINDETEENVIPVCRLTAKIGLVKDDQGRYHLEVQNFTNKFYTDALVSSKAPPKEKLEQHLSLPNPL